MSLREKLKLILREHGLTITAVLTSLGLIISTIVSSLTGGAATGGSTTPPKNPNKLGEWVKNKLKASLRLLGRLAGKAAAALPGIRRIGRRWCPEFSQKGCRCCSGARVAILAILATLIGYKLVDSIQKPKAKKS